MFIRTASAVAAMLVFGLSAAWTEFAIQEESSGLTVAENGEPVLVFRQARVAPPEGVAENLGRMSYIHPLYGPDGDVLTQDYPEDHYHHRGVFWAWPYTAVGERRMDIWAMGDARQVFEQWLVKDASAGQARIAAESTWRFDDVPEEAKVREEARFTVYPTDSQGRMIDVLLRFENVSGEPVTFLGAKTSNKGYGGFCVRPDATRAPLTLTTVLGVLAEDTLKIDTPWADVSSRVRPDGPYSGMAIFQHPKNSGYPHPGWILRHYGLLGASWPHNTPHMIAPGESLELQYSLYVHRGTAEEADVAGRFAAYERKERGGEAEGSARP